MNDTNDQIPSEELARREKASRAFERDCGDGNHEPETREFEEGELPREQHGLASITVCGHCTATLNEERADGS